MTDGEMRLRRLEPAPEDWIWYITLPCVIYVALAVTPLFLRTHVTIGLFGIAAVALALLLVGIHNAWDTVAHLVVSGREGH